MLLYAVFGAVMLALAMVWKACLSPFVAMLRAMGLSPTFSYPDVDMSGRVAIVTGANTGESCHRVE